MRLDEMVLIKDNHLAALGPNSVSKAVQRARERLPRTEIEVECDTLAQVQQAIQAGARRLLLDNMPPSRLRRAVRSARSSRRRIELEASGGVTLGNVGRIARTGVDFVSVGAITHSAPALDFSLTVERE
jgi:nicotinate-nucleotide pyrophosphorylase (carboxylating)